MGRTLGVGLIGCGNFGQVHAASLARIAEADDLPDGARIRPVAASDPSEVARAKAVRNWPFERFGPDPALVLDADDVDVVYIATPTFTHRDLILAALAAGKHVYAEKPVAPRFDTVREVCAAATGSGVTTQVGFLRRFLPALARVRELVATGAHGPPMAYVYRDDQFFPTTAVDPNVSDWRSDPASSGGGPLLEHSIHGIDYLDTLFGPVTAVSCATRSVLGYGLEDSAAVTLTHADGTVGTLVTVYGGVVGREEGRLEVFLEKAAIEATWGIFADDPSNSLSIQLAGERNEHLDPEELLAAELQRRGVTQRPFFLNELSSRDFLTAVLRSQPAAPGFDDALHAHAAVEAAYRSAATGTVVRTAPLLDGIS